MKQYILGMNPGVNGLNYHDPSVCLMDEGRIIFSIEEERLNRIRHSSGIFPKNAVEVCKKIAEDNHGKIYDIAIGHQPQLWVNRSPNRISGFSTDKRMVLSAKIKSLCGLPKARVSFFEHHKAHAASAYYCSGFSDALCIVIDGAGEYAAASAWIANTDGLTKIHEIKMPNSLGYFYAQATSYLGFQPWGEEGKLMALAPYGRYNTEIEETFEHFFYDDSYDLSSLVSPCLSEGYKLDMNISNVLLTKIFNFPLRKKDKQLSDLHKDFAYAVQTHTEKTVELYIGKMLRQTKKKQLCVAGGLFMNCKMNGYLRDVLPIEKFYAQPVSGDAGTALGAAILQSVLRHNVSRVDLNGLSLGMSYSDEEIVNALNQRACDYHFLHGVAEETAQLLAKGKIVAWFQGNSELGCRALCHRSILAAPHPYEVSNKINRKIKHRESWRPFACTILEEFADGILCNYKKSQQPEFMIEAFSVKKEWQGKIEAVIHRSDCSTRPQIIKNTRNTSLMHEVLTAFHRLTGLPLVLNTSLNDKGQPIIQTPEQAILFFEEHDVDALVIGNYILLRK